MEHSEFKSQQAQPEPQQQVPQQQQKIESSFGQDFILLINILKSWSDSETDIARFWEFIGRYITLAESNSNIVVSILEQIYGRKSQHGNFILTLNAFNPKTFKSVINFFESILGLRSNNLNEQQKMDLKYLQLEFEDRAYLKAILGMIKKLPKESYSELNEQFIETLKKMGVYDNNSNTTTSDSNAAQGNSNAITKKSSSEFLEKEVSLPGTSKKLKTKYIIGIAILIAVILFGLFYFFYLRKGNSSKGGGSSSIKFNEASSYISDGVAGGGGGSGSDTSVVFSEG